MTQPITPEALREIVEEVYRRVSVSLQSGGAPAPSASSGASSGSPGFGADGKPASACSLAHGAASRPPETQERPQPSFSASSSAPASPSTPPYGAAPACQDLAPYIDHTLLKPTATDDQIRKLCEEARRHNFATVCVHSAHVPLCASLLQGSGVKVCSVIGFPLGAMSSEAKAFETRDAIAKGAAEVDMVIHVGKLQQGDYGYTFHDIEAVVRAAHGIPIKVIIETALLNDEQKIIACALAKAAGAHFVKTSTGFGPGGATAEDIALMRRIVGPDLGVKASGGVKDCPSAQKMVAAGANRIGASASVAIVQTK